MKKVIQMLNNGEAPEAFINGWKRWADRLILLDDPATANPEIPFLFGGNMVTRWTVNWLAQKRPCFVINRPFLGAQMHKQRVAWRMSVNSFACTKIGPMPYSRWPSIGLTKHNWKVKEVKNILIGPPRKSINTWTGLCASEWAEQIKVHFPGANIRVRLKEGMKGKGGRYRTLWNDFEWADLVVSYSSAITAEAFWYGKKVISPGVCPTWVACDNRFKHWSDPTEPTNRDLWHEHMGWIQFTNEEWASGDAQELTVQYQGWPTDVTAVDNPYYGY